MNYFEMKVIMEYNYKYNLEHLTFFGVNYFEIFVLFKIIFLDHSMCLLYSCTS